MSKNIKKISDEQMKKMLEEDDSQIESKKSKADLSVKEECQYDDEFENQNIEQAVQQYPSDHENADLNQSQAQNIVDQLQVESEIERQNKDEMAEEIEGSYQFKKQEDMSEAKSEFIESASLNKEIKQKKFNSKDQKKSLDQKKNDKNKFKKRQLPQKKQNNNKEKIVDKKPSKPNIKKQAKKIENQKEGPKKQILSQSEIKQKMKQIQQQKQALQKKKLQKQKQLEEMKRKQYEEAKRIQEQKREKNRKALEEQLKLKKKGGGDNKSQKSEIKIAEEQLKIPEKKTDFKYVEMKNEKKENEKKIKKIIQQENKKKLKKLNEIPSKKDQGEIRKAQFLQERKLLRERQNKMKNLQAKQEDTLIVKQLKKQINECRKFNIDKNEQIIRAEKSIAELSKILKEKQAKIHLNLEQQQIASQNFDFSQLSPIQKFVFCFPEAKNSQDIFNLIDANGDGVLSSDQIKFKLQEFKIDKDMAEKVYQILDQNSDGNVSKQQFTFIIDLQIKKQKDFREIMGSHLVNDPLDLEAKILDMKVKINYISKQISEYNEKGTSEAYEKKYLQLENKIKKLENRNRQYNQNKDDKSKPNVKFNTISVLINQMIQLKNEKNIKNELLIQFKSKFKQNLYEKNKLLANRVEDHLRMEQEVYKLKNEIQQRQLRFLSIRKIELNKKGYLEKQSKIRKQMEQAHQKAKQYQASILDPTKKFNNEAYAQQLKLLSAVIMIQRNYRKRKAMGEFSKLKNIQN